MQHNCRHIVNSGWMQPDACRPCAPSQRQSCISHRQIPATVLLYKKRSSSKQTCSRESATACCRRLQHNLGMLCKHISTAAAIPHPQALGFKD